MGETSYRHLNRNWSGPAPACLPPTATASKLNRVIGQPALRPTSIRSCCWTSSAPTIPRPTSAASRKPPAPRRRSSSPTCWPAACATRTTPAPSRPAGPRLRAVDDGRARHRPPPRMPEQDHGLMQGLPALGEPAGQGQDEPPRATHQDIGRRARCRRPINGGMRHGARAGRRDRRRCRGPSRSGRDASDSSSTLTLPAGGGGQHPAAGRPQRLRLRVFRGRSRRRRSAHRRLRCSPRADRRALARRGGEAVLAKNGARRRAILVAGQPLERTGRQARPVRHEAHPGGTSSRPLRGLPRRAVLGIETPFPLDGEGAGCPRRRSGAPFGSRRRLLPCVNTELPPHPCAPHRAATFPSRHGLSLPFLGKVRPPCRDGRRRGVCR